MWRHIGWAARLRQRKVTALAVEIHCSVLDLPRGFTSGPGLAGG